MRQITFQNVMTTDTVPFAKLGELACTPDGRIFRYVKVDEAVSRFHLTSNIANTDVDTVSSATDGAGNITRVTEGSAGWTPGQFAGAWGAVDDGTGEGQVFKVKDNTTDTLILETDWKLTTALAVADSDIVLSRPYLVVKTPITALLGQVRGFAQVAFADNDYGWVLKEGPGGVLPGAALTVDEFITPGDDTAGEVINVGSGETIDDVSIVGKTMVANTTADKATLAEVKIV